jgi:hypothetical protein
VLIRETKRGLGMCGIQGCIGAGDLWMRDDVIDPEKFKIVLFRSSDGGELKIKFADMDT